MSQRSPLRTDALLLETRVLCGRASSICRKQMRSDISHVACSSSVLLLWPGGYSSHLGVSASD
jgi:hypothetical protein